MILSMKLLESNHVGQTKYSQDPDVTVTKTTIVSTYNRNGSSVNPSEYKVCLALKDIHMLYPTV